MYKGKGFCGGVIYKPTWILTASHCMADIDVQFLKVVAGIHFRYWATDTWQTLLPLWSKNSACKTFTLLKKHHKSPYASFAVCQGSTTRRWTRAQNRQSRSLRSSCTKSTCQGLLTMTLPFSTWLCPSPTQRTPSQSACLRVLWQNVSCGRSAYTRWAAGAGGVKTGPPHTSCGSWKSHGFGHSSV